MTERGFVIVEKGKREMRYAMGGEYAGYPWLVFYDRDAAEAVLAETTQRMKERDQWKAEQAASSIGEPELAARGVIRGEPTKEYEVVPVVISIGWLARLRHALGRRKP